MHNICDLSIRRVIGLQYLYLSAIVGITPSIFSSTPSDAIHPSFEAGYEVMLLGWTSFQLGYRFNIHDRSSAAGISMLSMWR